MQQVPVLYIAVLFFSAMLLAYLAAWARLHDRVNAAREFFWLMVTFSVYTVGDAISLTRLDVSGALAAIRLEYFGLAFFPVFIILDNYAH